MKTLIIYSSETGNTKIINKFFHSFISFFRDIKENMVVCYIMKLDLYIFLC